MKYYIVENEIFTDKATAKMYAKKRTLHREFSGYMQTHVSVIETEENRETIDSIEKEIMELIKRWPEGAKKKMFDELQTYKAIDKE